MKKTLPVLLSLALIGLIANSCKLVVRAPWLLCLLIPAFLLCNLFAGTFALRTKSRRLKICYHGAVLLVAFLGSTLIAVVYHIGLAVCTLAADPWQVVLSALVCILVEAVVFWNGILCVYLTSVQLGIKQRLVGICCGMIPVVNLLVLGAILKTVFREISFETGKEQRNAARQAEQVCQTRYPILLVHGVFFRDSKYFNYWGRIPRELEQNGASVYYGEHPSAASVADSAADLARRIRTLVEELHCEKVNIIAHSKGGLDCRYALARLGMAPYVASLTTINTPHRGCQFADYLLTRAPEALKAKVSSAYNTALKKLGDPEPDFLAAVNDLTASACTKLDRALGCPDGVLCQSVGSCLEKARGGKFPLNFSYHLVNYFDGANDGLVSESSFAWGERYTLLKPTHRRGISHGDVIDLNRENIDGFDVREFYVNLVHDLKERGL